MTDRILCNDATGLTGTIYCVEGPFFGPLPPVDPANRAIYDRLIAANVPVTPYVAPGGPAPTVTGNQWAFALGDLGLAAAWRAGVARCKDKDQVRVGLIARDTPLLATDPLLLRVAANAGTDASGAALINVPTVFAKALTEPT